MWEASKPKSVEEVTEYVNAFGQTIRLGDRVCWPTWTAGISSGDVYRIEKRTYEHPVWNYAVWPERVQTGTRTEVRFRLRVKKDHSKPVIYHAYRAFKMEKPEIKL